MIAFSDRSVLIVAAWGLPTGWVKRCYRLVIEDRGFIGWLGLPKWVNYGGECCESCSSTLVLTSTLLKAGVNVDALIFGINTIVNPQEVSDGSSISEATHSLYLKYLNELIDTCTCCREYTDEIKRLTTIEVLPGLGSYFGWRFLGAIDHLFVKAFTTIISKLRSKRYSWIVLDVTHGINYQTITVLYAAVASAITMGKEKRLIIVNSEPAVGGGDRCVKTSNRYTIEQGELNINDVTRLQKIIHLIRVLRALKTLDTTGLGEVLKDLKENIELTNTLRKYLRFVNLLRNNLVALTYPNAYVESDDKTLTPLKELNICVNKVHKETALNIERIHQYMKPKILKEEKKVIYPPMSAFIVIDQVLDIVMGELCKELEKNGGFNNLIKYMENVVRIYNDCGYIQNKLMTENTLNELNMILKYIKEKAPIIIDEGSLTVYLYKLLYFKKSELRKAIREGFPLSITQDYVKNIVTQILRESSLRVDEHVLRNAIAHSGLEFSMLSSFKLSKVGDKVIISEVVFRDNVNELIKKVK